MHISVDKKKILVVGGAGYIGSHMVLLLLESGYEPVILDTVNKNNLKALQQVEFIVGDMSDKTLLQKIFANHQFAGVMHFASLIEVAESLQFPERYYQNNVAGTINLLNVMIENKIRNFVFSSSAAVYGEPKYTPIDENHPLNPITPYGRSKWMVEEILKDYAYSDKLNYAILRYFNAAGADPNARLGEIHEPESHLIPLLLQVAFKKTPNVTVYGRDYPTTDGTCIRDFVHVSDLCTAHLLAFEALIAGKKNIIYNIGSGQGYSVQQMIAAVSEITKQVITMVDGNRRLGDPAILVADTSLAKKELGWEPKYSNPTMIVKHAWQFICKNT